ncbi:MAG: NAD(P)H-dependent glycerol-3-phosphate dehydrogenase [Gemmataceae bacterium]
MPTQFSILGSGAWGTTIALLLARKADHRVRLWSYRPEHTRELRDRRENVRLLPGVPIPESIELESDIAKTLDGVDLCIAAVPTVYLRATLAKERPQLAQSTPVVSLCKGIENETFERPTEILCDLLGKRPYAVLSGPSHAEEVARGMPASVVAASADEQLAKRVQEWFCTDRFRVYTNADVIGVELAAALKNVIAIAAGICDGLQFGDNAKAALVTRGLVEMARFGAAHGADPATYQGLAGMGDLITTCFSRHGRNRRVGERLAKGEVLAEILASTEMVAEGVYTTRSVRFKAATLGLELPIINEIYRVLYENKSPRAAVEDLMQRTPVPERRIDEL